MIYSSSIKSIKTDDHIYIYCLRLHIHLTRFTSPTRDQVASEIFASSANGKQSRSPYSNTHFNLNSASQSCKKKLPLAHIILLNGLAIPSTRALPLAVTLACRKPAQHTIAIALPITQPFAIAGAQR